MVIEENKERPLIVLLSNETSEARSAGVVPDFDKVFDHTASLGVYPTVG